MTKIKTTRKPDTIHKKVRRHVKMAVIPYTANQFRPHLIRRQGIVSLLIIVTVSLFGSNLWSTGSVLGDTADITSVTLLQGTNSERTQRQLPPLKYSDKLSEAARMKADDMFAQQYWAHEAPNGVTPWHWFSTVGYDYAHAGENLAKNFRTTDATMNAWMASQEHRNNILNNNYTDVGFAVADGVLNGKQATIIVALYGRPATEVGIAGVSEVRLSIAPIVQTDGNLIGQFGSALQSASPTVLGSAVLLVGVALIALVAHAYRKYLPAPIRRSWRYHHGLYKAIGLTSVAIVIVALYSGGQI